VLQRLVQRRQFLRSFVHLGFKSFLKFQVFDLFFLLVQSFHVLAHLDDVLFDAHHLRAVTLDDLGNRDGPFTFISDLFVNSENIFLDGVQGDVDLVVFGMVALLDHLNFTLGVI